MSAHFFFIYFMKSKMMVNKAQEPLEKIKSKICSKCDHHHAIEGSLTKETLCDRKEGTCYIHNLQTLVNRATPKKPIKKVIDKSFESQGYWNKHYRTEYYCSICGEKLLSKNKSKFCYECGQALDWSENDVCN